jgi:hypothetical protein
LIDLDARERRRRHRVSLSGFEVSFFRRDLGDGSIGNDMKGIILLALQFCFEAPKWLER